MFDALTTERPYKKAWPIEKAIEYIESQAGKHFDPELVRLFLLELPKVLDIMACWRESNDEILEVSKFD